MYASPPANEMQQIHSVVAQCGFCQAASAFTIQKTIDPIPLHGECPFGGRPVRPPGTGGSPDSAGVAPGGPRTWLGARARGGRSVAELRARTRLRARLRRPSL